MEKCSKCGNYIPEGMKICPHCGLLPPRLFPHFFIYLALACVAVGCAVYYRPFLGAPALGQVSKGMLWAAFAIFTVFAVIFCVVCVIVMRDYLNRSYRGKLTKEEVTRFVNMKNHIGAGKHYYDNEIYCNVCGHKMPAKQVYTYGKKK